MAEAVSFDNITLEELPTPASFVVEHGTITVILTAKEEVNANLVRLILGFIHPHSGSVVVAGKDVHTLTKKDCYELRKEIGLVFSSGGLISNLKVWENLTLPLSYHSDYNQDEIDAKGVAALERIGYSGKRFDLIGKLSLFQKRMLGFARAMLNDPDLMIYESPLQGLNFEERNRFLLAALSFHAEKSGRTSIFFTSNQEAPAILKNATVISLIKGQKEC